MKKHTIKAVKAKIKGSKPKFLMIAKIIINQFYTGEWYEKYTKHLMWNLFFYLQNRI